MDITLVLLDVGALPGVRGSSVVVIIIVTLPILVRVLVLVLGLVLVVVLVLVLVVVLVTVLILLKFLVLIPILILILIIMIIIIRIILTLPRPRICTPCPRGGICPRGGKSYQPPVPGFSGDFNIYTRYQVCSTGMINSTKLFEHAALAPMAVFFLAASWW